MMQPGQFLVNKDGEKRKILGVCGEAIFLSHTDEFDSSRGNWFATEKDLKDNGWSLLEKPWVPKEDDLVSIVESGGKITQYVWDAISNEIRYFLLKTGNYAANYENAELYKQKLIERMGRKD